MEIIDRGLKQTTYRRNKFFLLELSLLFSMSTSGVLTVFLPVVFRRYAIDDSKTEHCHSHSPDYQLRVPNAACDACRFHDRSIVTDNTLS